MALRGKQPQEIKKKLKMFLYGKAGVGKSTLALSFPNVYVIDTEEGTENTQYLELIKANNGLLFQTRSFNEIVQEVRTLLTEKHEFKTLVIDPLTGIFETMCDMESKKVGTDFGRHIAAAAKELKRLLALLLELDMNVIITSHSKKEYGHNMAVLGETYDCYKKLDYLFDLVLELQKVGKRRTAVVKKSRIKTFKDDEEFDLSYAEIAKRYDADVLDSAPVEIMLASPEQIKELKNLIALLHIPQVTVDGWLTKAKCECLEDMKSDIMDKCIKSLKDKVEKGEKE